jgi:hypothetical protein
MSMKNNDEYHLIITLLEFQTLLLDRYVQHHNNIIIILEEYYLLGV